VLEDVVGKEKKDRECLLEAASKLHGYIEVTCWILFSTARSRQY
jgi:hypothetical protein